MQKKLVKKILLPIPFIATFCVLLASFLFFLGDAALEKDKLTEAGLFYSLSNFFDPFQEKMSQRILITNHLIAEKIEQSGETGDETLAYTSPVENKLVLGDCTTAPVLMYHYIRVVEDPKADPKGFDLSVTPYNFRLQMEYLAAHGYNTITLDELMAHAFYNAVLPQKPIVLTFDDSYRDFYTAAFPVLKELKLQATNFVITGFVDGPRYLTWDEISDMKSSGLITFEDHTITHASLPVISDTSLWHELEQSKYDLQSHVGYPINYIAYPGGTYNKHVESFAQKAGYIAAFTTKPGTCESKTTSFEEPRVRIAGSDSLSSFTAKLPWK